MAGPGLKTQRPVPFGGRCLNGRHLDGLAAEAGSSHPPSSSPLWGHLYRAGRGGSPGVAVQTEAGQLRPVSGDRLGTERAA
jgi:hypothetical protein